MLNKKRLKRLTVPLNDAEEKDITYLAVLLRMSKSAAVRFAVRRLLMAEVKKEGELRQLGTPSRDDFR
ncbi:MAG: hypothetical protein ACOC7S_00705 [Planctomycetota bacterium]